MSTYNFQPATAYNFSLAFERMASFVAISSTKRFEDTLQELILQCFVILNTDVFSSPLQISESISVLFGLHFTEEEIGVSIQDLLDKDILIKTSDGIYTLPMNIRANIQNKIIEATELEKRVKDQWFHVTSLQYPLLNLDDLWTCLCSYLSKTFRQHGLQTISLLNPTANHRPEDVESLSVLLRESIRNLFKDDLRTQAINAIAGFLADVGMYPDRALYITQLGDGAFNYFSLTVDPEIANRLRQELSTLTLFLDTNFLFGLMDVHVSPQVKTSVQLVNAIRANQFPFSLRFHQSTQKEMGNTIGYFTDRLRTYRWTRALSRAAIQSRYLSGIELKFHQINAETGIDVETFVKRFEHADIFLRENDILIYRSASNRIKERSDLINEYQEFLKRRRTEKPYEAIDHDMTVLDTVRLLRSKATSSLDAAALIVTCDFNLYKFDWEYSRKKRELPCTALPNSFWQTLRPYIPSTIDYNRTFAETFAIPEFRTIGGGAARATSRLLGLLSTYKGLPEETAVRLISNDLLLDGLRNTQDDQKFQEMVDLAIVHENEIMLQEKQALEKQIEQERAVAKDFETKVREIAQQGEEAIREKDRQLEEVSRMNTQEKERAEQAFHSAQQERIARVAADAQAEKEKKIREQAIAEAENQRRLKEEAERHLAEEAANKNRINRMLNIFAVALAILISSILSATFIWLVYNIPVKFIVENQNSYGIQGCICALIFCLVFTAFRPQWWKWCLGVAAVSFVGILFQIIGGPSRQ